MILLDINNKNKLFIHTHVSKINTQAYILVINKLHELELSICTLSMCNILEWTAQFLDSNVLLGNRVISSTATNKNKTTLHQGSKNIFVHFCTLREKLKDCRSDIYVPGNIGTVKKKYKIN